MNVPVRIGLTRLSLATKKEKPKTSFLSLWFRIIFSIWKFGGDSSLVSLQRVWNRFHHCVTCFPLEHVCQTRGLFAERVPRRLSLWPWETRKKRLFFCLKSSDGINASTCWSCQQWSDSIPAPHSRAWLRFVSKGQWERISKCPERKNILIIN